MSIYTPTGVKRFQELPLLNIDETNENTIEILSIDTLGRMYKTPITQLKNYLGVSYTNLLTGDENQIILGRYSDGYGSIQKITLGDNLFLNSDTGLLDSVITIGGEAGGDFEGVFPNPTLKNNSVTLDKFEVIEGNVLLGRGGEDTGEVEIIRIGSEFTIDTDTNTLHLTSVLGNIVDTGWIIFTKKENFVATPSAMYFVIPSAEEVITVTILENWSSGEQIVVINKGEGNVVINTPNEFINFESNGVMALNLICDGDDNFYNI